MTRQEAIVFGVEPLPPFRLDLTTWVLRRHEQNVIDRFDGTHYKRVIFTGNRPIELCVSQFGTIRKSRLACKITGRNINSSDTKFARNVLEKLLGYRIDLREFYESILNSDSRFGALAKRFMGVKPPRFPSIFETLLNAISCQQVSLNVGLLLLSRLAQRYGAKMPGVTGAHSFPSPEKLCNLEPEGLRPLGYSRQKSRYIIGLAKSVVEGQLELESLANMNDQDALDYLQEIPGIGRWSSEYALLRGLGRLRFFPGDDVGGQSGLKKLFGLRKSPDYERIRKIMRPWKDYAGMIYFHLRLRSLEKDGFLDASSSR